MMNDTQVNDVQAVEITRAQAVKMIAETNGDFFGVTFRKRTPPHDLRSYNPAKLGVKKYLAGGEAAYNFTEKGLIPCFEMGNNYRSIPIEGILEVRYNKKVYKVVD